MDCRAERNMQSSGPAITEVTARSEMMSDTVTGKQTVWTTASVSHSEVPGQGPAPHQVS